MYTNMLFFTLVTFSFEKVPFSKLFAKAVRSLQLQCKVSALVTVPSLALHVFHLRPQLGHTIIEFDVDHVDLSAE